MMKYATLGVAIAALTAPLAHAQGPYVGEIRQFAANYCPVGWAQANGAMLPISQNQVLFSLLGTTYGGDVNVSAGILLAASASSDMQISNTGLVSGGVKR